jgi:hypothetical protein
MALAVLIGWLRRCVLVVDVDVDVVCLFTLTRAVDL